MATFSIGSVVARITADASGFKKAIGDVKTSVEGGKKSLGDLGGTIGKVAGVFGLALGAAAFVKGMKDSIDASNKMNNALLGLATVARAFGQDAQGAQSAAKTLAKDGLMSVSDAATGLKNLLASGFSLPEAISLMNTLKDSAAFNRQGFLSFGEAVSSATEGIKNGNSILVDNAGITKNLSVILEEAGYSAQDLMRASQDAGVRQAILNGILKEGSIFAGDAGRAADTLAGKEAQLGTATFNLQSAIGQALTPALELLISSMTGSFVEGAAAVNKSMIGIQYAAIAVAVTFQQLAAVIVGVFGMIFSALTFNAKGLKDSFSTMVGSMSQNMTNAQNKMVDVVVKSNQKQLTSTKSTMQKEAEASDKKSKKIIKDLEEETRKYEEEMKKRKAKFEDDLADLIHAHQDKRDSIKKDIDAENSDYNENMDERKKDFAEKLIDMETAHQEKVDEIMAQIDEEKAKGDEANQETIASLEARLVKENEAYTAAKAKAETQEAEATAKLQKEHDKRIESYNAELKVEEDLLHKHQADVDAVKDKARLDDIDRLKLQFSQENEEATKEHNRRMVEIRERGDQLGNTLGSSIDGALGAQGENIKKTMGDVGKNAAEEMKKGVIKGAKEAGEAMISNFIRGIVDKTKELVSRIGEAVVRNKLGPSLLDKSELSSLQGFAEGGVVPGAPGEPRVLLAHGQETIVPYKKGLESAGGGQIHVHLDNAIIADDASAARVSEKIGDYLMKKLKQNVRY